MQAAGRASAMAAAVRHRSDHGAGLDVVADGH